MVSVGWDGSSGVAGGFSDPLLSCAWFRSERIGCGTVGGIDGTTDGGPGDNGREVPGSSSGLSGILHKFCEGNGDGGWDWGEGVDAGVFVTPVVG